MRLDPSTVLPAAAIVLLLYLWSRLRHRDGLGAPSITVLVAGLLHDALYLLREARSSRRLEVVDFYFTLAFTFAFLAAIAVVYSPSVAQWIGLATASRLGLALPAIMFISLLIFAYASLKLARGQ
jgi:hypothetical protein